MVIYIYITRDLIEHSHFLVECSYKHIKYFSPVFKGVIDFVLQIFYLDIKCMENICLVE